MENNKEQSDEPDMKADGKRQRKRSQPAPEPRTPLKRQRIPVQKFQSPAEELIPVPSTSKHKETPELLHKKGSFLGVRGDEGSFYLCKTVQNVFNNTRKFKIQWLDLDQPPDIYKLDFLDTTDADCILTNVKMEKVVRDTYRLPIKEQTRVEEILHKALKKERGEPIEDLIPPVVSEEEDEDWEDEPLPKKAKASSSKSKKGITVSLKGKGSKGKQTKSEKKDKSSKSKKKEEKKKGPDRNLKPNPKVKVLEKEPFFETKDKTDFISKTVQGKLAIRAVLTKDLKLLESLVEDKDKCYKLDEFRSVDVRKNALHYALERNYHEAINILVKDYCRENERVKKGSPQTVLIQSSDKGTYNPMSLGIRAIRPISQSRGSKQGNDAFIKDLNNDSMYHEDYSEDALKLGVTKETLDVLMAANPDTPRETLMENTSCNIYLAVLCGNRKLAGKLIEEAMKDGSCGFSFLHKEVLLFDKEELRQTILAASVKKKPWDNKSLTPLHCAAINPNVNYLSRLLTVEPNINLEDRDHRRPIHYSAVCEGVGPLEFLLQRGASPLEVDNQGMTPLHYACSAGRPRNVDILLKKSKEASQKQGDIFGQKWGPGGVDRPSRSSYCPIHIAVSYGHADVVKILIKHQVNVNKPLSAGKNRITPLMIAASHGSLEIARILVQNGALVEQLDKLKKSALMHAVMNGNTHVASYLLYLGADPNRCDSSENTVVHYAAAYGWQFPMKLLVDVGATLNRANQWKTTPVGIAFLKGHIGIVDYLLRQPGVDINFKNDAGMTLSSIAASSALEAGLYEQVQYLMEKKADPTVVDVNGFDTLHHLASNKVVSTGWGSTGEPLDDKMELTVKIATLLLDAGCDPRNKTNDGKTALMLAIEQLNIKLVQLLVNRGGTVTSEKSDSKTILHLMADLCMKSDFSPIIKILVDQKFTAKEKTQAKDETPANEEQEKKVVENGENGDEKEGKKQEGSGDAETKTDASEAMETDEGEKKKEVTENDVSKEHGDAVNGEVNGMEVDEAPPSLKKFSDQDCSQASQEDIWPMMAAEVDDSGYTPLLWACKVYRDFKKQGSMTDNDVKRFSENGRNFIKALIELTGADVSVTVKEKVLSENTLATNEKDKYTKDGKCSVLHLLLRVGHEVLEHLTGLGLETVLKYSPNLEHRDLDGNTPLTVAVNSKSEKSVSLLIAAGADVNVVFGDEATVGTRTPLHVAAQDMNVKMVRMLLDAKANVKVLNSKTQLSPLHIAVQNREDEAAVIEITKMLLEAGADVNCGKTTPLHSAVLGNCGTTNASTELEEFLIAKGANVFARDMMERIPLHYAFITKANPASVSPLDPIELCSVLVESMGEKQLDSKDEMGRSPLHLAAMRGATICCVHLLQRNVPVLAVDKKGFTALALAVKNKHDSCAIMLLRSGAKVDNTITVPGKQAEDRQEYVTLANKKKKPIWTWMPTKDHQPPVKDENYDIYQMAISRELQGVAHVVLDSVGLSGKAVEAALKVNKYHIVLRHLHRMKGDDVVRSYVNSDAQNLLHVLALCTKPGQDEALQLKIAKVLVEKGVSLSQLDKYKRYPITYAALNHQPIGLARYFLECSRGLDLNQVDVYSRTVMVAYFWDPQKMYEANKTTKLDYIELLVKAGASLDVPYSVQWHVSPMFDVVFRQCALDFFSQLSDYGMMTPLISAMYSCDFNLIKFLLKQGASPNLPDHQGITPIMHAVKINDIHLVKLLLNNDYEIPGPESDKNSPKYGLKKRLSRKVFMIKPSQQLEMVEEDANNNEDRDAGSEDEDEDKDSEMNSEGENEEEEEMEQDSDHDTDCLEDEDEDDSDPKAQHLPIPRLASKQPSIKRMATSLASTDKEDFETVEKTSSVQLDAVDSAGMSLIHHVVSPVQYGTFDNEEILYVLAKAGAPLEKTNSSGETPLQVALKVGAVALARRLQTLAKLEAENQKKVTICSFHKGFEPDGLLTGEERTMEADAAAMLKRLTPEKGADTGKVKPMVDKQCMAADSGELVYDQTNQMLYDITLSKIDVRSLLNDTYNFYKIQIVYHKAKDIYILFTKWGRIGDTGMFQHTPYQKLSEAVAAFCKVFKSKTGNSWSALKSFVNQPKKYRPVLLDNQPTPVVKVDLKLETSIPSKLPEDVQDLLKEMADVGMMNAAMKNVRMAEEFMPFGNIKRDALIEGRKLLQSIGELVVEIEKKKRAISYDNDEHQADCEKMAELSTEYYSLVPQEGYSFDRVRPLNNMADIKSKLRLISCLLDLECASKILLGAQYRINECNPLDYIYQSIGCTIQPLRESDVESQYILKYISSSTSTSGSKPKVLNIFKLWRAGEEDRLQALNLGNHQLLWHGSGLANFMSILHNGLLVAPVEAPVTGHAFGEGIYTADTFDKSQGYCHNYNPQSKVKLALLCEVALGNCKEDIDKSANVDLINSEYNSLKIHGRQAPDGDWRLSTPYGAVIPVGCIEENSFRNAENSRPWIPYNEYIVQNSDQICLRYLVQFV